MTEGGLNPTEQFAIDLYTVAVLVCRLNHIGWARSERIAGEIVRKCCFNAPLDGWEEKWDAIQFRHMAESLDKVFAPK